MLSDSDKNLLLGWAPWSGAGGPNRLRTANCVRLGVWIALVLFPLPWVWINPTSGLPPPPKRLPPSLDRPQDAVSFLLLNFAYGLGVCVGLVLHPLRAVARIRFRMTHVLYCMSVLAASLGLFHWDGLAIGLCVLLFWAYVFSTRRRLRGLMEAGILSTGLFAFIMLTQMSSSSYSDGLPFRSQCRSNLGRIAVALHSYHDVYGQFPPAFVPDKQGKPMHSWRVLLLPFLDKEALYGRYNFAEPWNSPDNRRLLSQRPDVFACPEHTLATGDQSSTSYAAVVGSGTVWPGATGAQHSEIRDPLAETVLLLETSDLAIPWTEPRDTTIEQSWECVTSPKTHETDGCDVNGMFVGKPEAPGFFTFPTRGHYVVMADSSTKLVNCDVDRATWENLVTCNDGSVLTARHQRRVFLGPYQIDVGNCVRLGIWLALVIYPLYWVWISSRSNTSAGRTA